MARFSQVFKGHDFYENSFDMVYTQTGRSGVQGFNNKAFIMRQKLPSGLNK